MTFSHPNLLGEVTQSFLYLLEVTRKARSSRGPQRLHLATMSAPSTSNGDGANGDSVYAFGMPKDAWDHYTQYRPAYPVSQWNTWIDYHSGPLNVIHEIGTGCGIGAAGLLGAAKARGQPVKHAVLSDPTASNVAVAKAMLATGRFSDTDFTFYREPAEASFLEPGSVDMVIACECLHWTELGASMARMHESLRPGGTVAVVFYDMFMGDALGIPRITEALDKVVGDLIAGVKEGRHKYGPKSTADKRRNVVVGLNDVPFDPEMWADAKRIYINIPDGQTEWPVHPEIRKFFPYEGSKVDEKNETLEWISDPEGWGIKECTVDWVRGTLGTTQIEMDPKFWEGPLWKELVEAVDEQGGKFWASFRASYIMARKK